MRFSISIPQLDTDGLDTDGLKDYLVRAEELGFEGGWVLEFVIGEPPLIAPLEMLAYAAACTERLRLGVAVLVSSLHDPIQLASSITAVDRLSHGRLDVGVAPGGGFRQFSAFGVDPETFVTRFTEGLQLMKAIWSDEPRINFDGRFRQVSDAAFQPKPVQRPHPPIWFGGSARKALARAVRHGDAFLGAGSTATATFAKQVTESSRGARRARQRPRRLPDRQAGLPRGRRRPRPGARAGHERSPTDLRRPARHRGRPGVRHGRRRRRRLARGRRGRRRAPGAQPRRAATSRPTARRWSGWRPT